MSTVMEEDEMKAHLGYSKHSPKDTIVAIAEMVTVIKP